MLALALIVGGVIGAQLGADAGASLRGEQLRILLALIVLGGVRQARPRPDRDAGRPLLARRGRPPMRRPRRRLAPATLLAVALTAAAPARAEGLVADLSEHLIAITTAFVGTDVVLFGTSDGGADIVVTVVGPRENQIVRRKARDRRHLAQSRQPGVRAGAELLRGGQQRAARPDRPAGRAGPTRARGRASAASSRSTRAGLEQEPDRRLPGRPGAQQAATGSVQPRATTDKLPRSRSCFGPH